MENGNQSELSPAFPQPPPTSLQPHRTCDYDILEEHSSASASLDSGSSQITTTSVPPSAAAARTFSQFTKKNNAEDALLGPVHSHQGVVGDSFVGESSEQPCSTGRMNVETTCSDVTVINGGDISSEAASTDAANPEDDKGCGSRGGEVENGEAVLGHIVEPSEMSSAETEICSATSPSTEKKSSRRLIIAQSLREAAMLLTRVAPTSMDDRGEEERLETVGVLDRQSAVETAIQARPTLITAARMPQQQAMSMKPSNTGGAQGNAFIKVADSDWLRAIQMQAVGACRVDDRLQPMMRWNLTCFGADGQVLVDLGQHFKAKEMAMLVRCLLAPLVSIRVGKVARQGRLLVPLPTRGCLSLVMLPGSELRLYFAADGGGCLERLAMMTGGLESTNVKLELLAEDAAARTFSLRLPSGRRTYFWQAEKSKACGDELLEKLKDLLATPPTLTDLTGINETRLDAFAQLLRTALLTAPGTATPVGSTTTSSPSLPHTHICPSSPSLPAPPTLPPSNFPPPLPSKPSPSSRASFRHPPHLPPSLRSEPHVPRRTANLTRRSSFPPASTSHLPLKLYRSSGELRDRNGNNRTTHTHMLGSTPSLHQRSQEAIPLHRPDASGMPLFTSDSKPFLDNPTRNPPLTTAEFPLPLSRRWDLLPPARRQSRMYGGGGESSPPNIPHSHRLKMLRLQAESEGPMIHHSLYQHRYNQMKALRTPLPVGHAKAFRSRQDNRAQETGPYWVHTPSSLATALALARDARSSSSGAKRGGGTGGKSCRAVETVVVGLGSADVSDGKADVDADVSSGGAQSPEQLDVQLAQQRADSGPTGPTPSLPQTSACQNNPVMNSLESDLACKGGSGESSDEPPSRCGCQVAGLEGTPSTSSSSLCPTSTSTQTSASGLTPDPPHHVPAQKRLSLTKESATQIPDLFRRRSTLSPPSTLNSSPPLKTMLAPTDTQGGPAMKVMSMPSRTLGRGMGWIASNELEQRHGVWLPAHHHSHIVASPPHIPPPPCPPDMAFKSRNSRGAFFHKGEKGPAPVPAMLEPAIAAPNLFPKRTSSELQRPLPGWQWHSEGSASSSADEGFARLGVAMEKPKEDPREVRGEGMGNDEKDGGCEAPGLEPSSAVLLRSAGGQGGVARRGVWPAGMPGGEMPDGVRGGVLPLTGKDNGSVVVAGNGEVGKRKVVECLPLRGGGGLRELVAVQDEVDAELVCQDWQVAGGAAASSGGLSRVNGGGMGRGFVFMEKAGRRCGLGILSDSRFGGDFNEAVEGRLDIREKMRPEQGPLQAAPSVAVVKPVDRRSRRGGGDCPSVSETLPSFLEKSCMKPVESTDGEKDGRGLP